MRGRVRAAELVGRGWLNTGGAQLRLGDFRGKVLLLDFWTFCCINCLHVLDELRPVEEEFSDVLVTVGVHSPKFRHEADAGALAAAVERYGVRHPVLDDPELTTWQAYAVKAWPTLVVVDPEGYVVHIAAGEGHAEALRRVIGEVVRVHEEKGTLHRGDGPYVPSAPEDTELRFPAKAVAVGGSVVVADTAHHRVVRLGGDGETVLAAYGTGERGRQDGVAATFSEPSAVAVLPEAVAARVGYDLVVADTVNHLLRGVDSATGEVTTVAGTGEPWRNGPTSGKATEVDLSSPWDLTWWEPAGGVVVAMAGNHTLGLFDPVAEQVSRFAGTTVEGLKDGPKEEAFFAQTSGLAATPERLWLVDAETSALRYLDTAGAVHTVVGKGLFDFGHRDGDAAEALFEHPLGVTALADGSVVVADTYNGALRRYDPATGQVSTVATGIAEPSGAVVVDGELLVVASAAHRLERTAVAVQEVVGEARQVVRPTTAIAAGAFTLDVVFSPPPGQKQDDRFGPSTRLEVTSSPPELLVSGAGESTDLRRELVISDAVGSGVLHVVAQAASCDTDDAEHGACHLTRQDWGVPVEVGAGGLARLALVLGGLDDQA
ncbi:NHL domain-containing thioredoxin family protein [Actinokineospora bangkokensis]|uniref:Alkyl hydroperoxide reductase n=1 Tax=Actinokineospora bangkokensis TaxID=1193682 RepID=A0A1Q9LFZ4_9PSEU|nr:NHL domain-containing thioredoxin family protein [Actinokineospora bangkokensis]OLR90958.1 alkyl hydroperoxide reductase [Actinokineospora bangkokensis]